LNEKPQKKKIRKQIEKTSFFIAIAMNGLYFSFCDLLDLLLLLDVEMKHFLCFGNCNNNFSLDRCSAVLKISRTQWLDGKV
jgi:hypothetical protein